MVLDLTLIRFIPTSIMVSMLPVVGNKLLYGLLLRSQITRIQVTGLWRAHIGLDETDGDLCSRDQWSEVRAGVELSRVRDLDHGADLA
jgi:hypothetical protein